MNRKLVSSDDPILRETCKEVERIDDDLRNLVSEMSRIMRSSCGIGIAAPQVGDSRRVFLVGNGDSDLVVINPELECFGEIRVGPEGCLSLPGQTIQVPRHTGVRIKATSINGERFELELKGYFAVVMQHEFDHLNGLLIDRFVSEPADNTKGP